MLYFLNFNANGLASVKPSNVTYPAVIWSSDKPLVASVNQNGTIIGLTEGVAKISATSSQGGFASTCNVTVVRHAVESVTLNADSIILDINKTQKLIATVLPANATNPKIS